MDRGRFSLETIVYVLVGLLFFAIVLIYYSAAFPTASIRLDVTGTEARQIAGQFLKTQGYDPSGHQEAAVFSDNNTGAVFLQQTQGMEKANEMVDGEVPIWRWQCRWFQSG